MEIISWSHEILLIGASFALLLSFFMWFYPKSHFSNKILAILLFIVSFSVSMFALQSNQFFFYYPHFFGIGTGLYLLYFPLVFLYIKSSLHNEIIRVKKYYIHSIPFLLYFVVLSPLIFLNGDDKILLINSLEDPWVFNVIYFTDLFVSLQGILYTILSLRAIHNFEFLKKYKLKKSEINILSWLSQFIKINAILWCIGSTGAILDLMGINTFIDLYSVFYVGLTLLIIWVSFIVINKPETFISLHSIDSVPFENTLYNMENEDIVNDDIELLMNFIKTHKPYLNNNVSLKDLCDGTGLTKLRISDILNNDLQKSFYEVINEFRTKEAIRLLENNKHHHTTLVNIGELSGFNSKTSFNRNFKKYTSKTPSEFINE